MALAAATAFTGRKRSLPSRTAGRLPWWNSFFLKSTERFNVNLPHDFVLAPFNDIEGTAKILSGLPEDSLAAIIVECTQGSGGCIVGSKEFLQFLDTTAKNIVSLLIIDEVMTSRLSYHGYSSHMGLKPDLVIPGKWVGGGMTFGAFGRRKDIMNMSDPRSGILGHSGAFITMAASSDMISDFGRKPFHKHAINTSHDVEQETEVESPVSELASSMEDDSNPSMPEKVHEKNSMWSSGYGSMFNIHFGREKAQSLRAGFWHWMLNSGIYMAQRGFVALNIELTESHADKFVEADDLFIFEYLPSL